MERVLFGSVVGAERSGTRSFGPDWQWHPTAEFFLSFAICSLFRGAGSRSALLRCTGRPPPRHGRWSTTGGTSAGAWGVWAKHRGGSSLRDGRGRCAPLDADGTRLFPLREKVCPHSTCTHPQRAHSAHARQRTLRDTTRTLSHARV